jgi:hypothetical protein
MFVVTAVKIQNKELCHRYTIFSTFCLYRVTLNCLRTLLNHVRSVSNWSKQNYVGPTHCTGAITDWGGGGGQHNDSSTDQKIPLR